MVLCCNVSRLRREKHLAGLPCHELHQPGTRLILVYQNKIIRKTALLEALLQQLLHGIGFPVRVKDFQIRIQIGGRGLHDTRHFTPEPACPAGTDECNTEVSSLGDDRKNAGNTNTKQPGNNRLPLRIVPPMTSRLLINWQPLSVKMIAAT